MAFKKGKPPGKRKLKFPKGDEVLGVVEQLLGFAKMRVKCSDGNTRICRVPGRLTRYLWIRERDVVLVKPWETKSDEKGDVLFKYRKNYIGLLRKKGLLGEIADEV